MKVLIYIQKESVNTADQSMMYIEEKRRVLR